MRIVRSIQVFAAESDKHRSCNYNNMPSSADNPSYINPERTYIFTINAIKNSAVLQNIVLDKSYRIIIIT